MTLSSPLLSLRSLEPIPLSSPQLCIWIGAMGVSLLLETFYIYISEVLMEFLCGGGGEILLPIKSCFPNAWVPLAASDAWVLSLLRGAWATLSCLGFPLVLRGEARTPGFSSPWTWTSALNASQPSGLLPCLGGPGPHLDTWVPSHQGPDTSNRGHTRLRPGPGLYWHRRLRSLLIAAALGAGGGGVSQRGHTGTCYVQTWWGARAVMARTRRGRV